MVKTAISAKRKTVFKGPKKVNKKEVEVELEDFDGIGEKLDTLEYLTNPDNIGKAMHNLG